MAVITISKEYGSSAEEIALRVCRLLGYRYFEKRNILQIAEEAGFSDSELLDITVDELEKKNLLGEVTRKIIQIPVAGYSSQGTAGYGSTMSTYLYRYETLNREKALNLTQSLLRSAAKKGNLVISGRGGQALFRNTPGIYHVRVIAPLETRIEAVATSEGLDENSARKLIRKHDAAAEEYLRKTYHIEWDDPSLYHLVINTEKLDLDRAADIIADMVRYEGHGGSIQHTA